MRRSEVAVMKNLILSDDLSLPLEAATRRMAILAMSGAGKSNLAVLMAEQMFDAGIPWVAIDPKGDWWGVRSNASGKGPGLPVPIFGGLHADVKIESTAAAGAELAALIAGDRITCVIDISEFVERQKMWAFLAAFGETLLHKNRTALHLFLEEADEYLPQSTKERGNLPKCLGVWQRVVKRGRFRGIGSTQITQRNAALNKDTLYQAECLFALRATGKGDRKAVAGWVEYHDAASEIVDSLPTLEDGEGWVSSPAWLKVTKRTRFYQRRTFDSGATPVLVAKGAKPATLATIDLGAIRQRMDAAIERAKNDDPAELRKQLVEAKREIAHLQKRQPQEKTKVVEKPIVSDAQLARIEKIVERGTKMRSDLADLLDGSLSNALNDLRNVIASMKQQRPNAWLDNQLRDVAQQPSYQRQKASLELSRKQSTVSASGDLGKGERAILTVLAHYADGKARRALGTLSGYSASGGSFGTYLSRLRGKGYIEGSDVIRITGSGRQALGEIDELPRGKDLQQYWLNRLGKGEAAILRVMLDEYPAVIDRDELGRRAGYEASGGSFGTYLSRLRTKELIDERELRASEAFFQ
jgi:hypothetical protein